MRTLNVTLLMSSASSFVSGFELFSASKSDVLPHLSQTHFWDLKFKLWIE